MNKKLSRIYLLATFTVALFYNQSIVAQSLSFDGVDDYVSIGDNSNFDLQDAITVSVIVKPSSLQTTSIIDRWAGNEVGYRLAFRGGDQDPSHPGAIWAQFGADDKVSSGNNVYSPNEWIEITGVWKNNNYIKLYFLFFINFKIDFSIVKRDLVSEEQEVNTMFYSIGLKTDLFNHYYDF